MSKLTITKDSKILLGVIEAEGGRVLDVRVKKKHLHVDYTFDGQHIYHQSLPNHGFTGGKWVLNFRTAIRRAKRDAIQRQAEEPST